MALLDIILKTDKIISKRRDSLVLEEYSQIYGDMLKKAREILPWKAKTITLRPHVALDCEGRVYIDDKQASLIQVVEFYKENMKGISVKPSVELALKCVLLEINSALEEYNQGKEIL
jgi:hypothetical protein